MTSTQSMSTYPSVTPVAENSEADTPTFLKLLVIAIFVPDDLFIRIQGLLLSPARLVLILMIPTIVSRLSLQIRQGSYRFVLSDLFVPLAGVWMFLALTQTSPLQDAMTHAPPLILEFCVGYMASRTLLVTGAQIMAFVSFLCLTIAIVALLGLPDTATHRFFIHDLCVSIFGGIPYVDAGYRLGLLRATSTLEHPILFGTTCSIGLLLAASMPIERRRFVLLSCAIGIVIALSSAPIQSVIMGFGLLFYKRLLADVPFRWAGLIGLALAAIFAIAETVPSPFGFIFNHLVFDVESAYYRLYTWQMAGVALHDSPWYGLGFVFPKEYEIPGTVDSLWLFWSLLFGIPGAVLLAIALLGAASRPTSGSGVNLLPLEIRLGTILGILIFLVVFLGFTVHFFGAAWILIPILLGLRARLGELGATSDRADEGLAAGSWEDSGHDT